MKLILLVAATNALTIERGIDKGALMQSQGAHWRKSWPEGDTDAGEGDEDVINIGGPRIKPKRKPFARFIAPDWTLDEEVVKTQGSLNLAEGATGSAMSEETVKDRAMGILA